MSSTVQNHKPNFSPAQKTQLMSMQTAYIRPVEQQIADRSTYAMSATELAFGGAESVCGEDERVLVDPLEPPFEAIAFLGITTSDGRKVRGTGFYINYGSRSAILTAGHNLCIKDHGGFCQKISIIRSRDGDRQPYGTLFVSRDSLRVPAPWEESADETQDWGIILLDGSPWGFCCASLTDEQLGRNEVRTAGYPADKEGCKMWYDHGPIANLNKTAILYMEDTYGGQSGSPVWTKHPDTSDWVVVGVHTYGGCPNKATRVTDAMLDQIDEWLK